MSKDKTIYNDYFDYTDEYINKYGEQTVVFMQVGAFFEIYGVKTHNDINERSKITEIAKICHLSISSKKQSFENGVIVMAGFRDYTVDKYISKLTDNGFTVPVYIQEKNGNEVKRVLSNVYSPGTYISCETDSKPAMSNNIMTIWFEIYKPSVKTLRTTPNTRTNEILIYGVSVIDIFTGHSSIFQHETPFHMNVTTFDELERYVSIYVPSEIIIISPFEDSTIQTIIQYAGIQTNAIHIVNSTQKNEQVLRCTYEKYLKEVLANFYKEDTYDVCRDFQEYILATQSFCYLLNFIQEHNGRLTTKISLPTFNNTSNRVILPNHTLLQLNIIGDMTLENNKMGKLSSVMSLLNTCNTPMGRRLFQSHLTTPTFDESWLTNEYTQIEMMLDREHYTMVESFRQLLAKIKDMDKMNRQIVVRAIHPSSIYSLYNSLIHTQQMNVCLYEDNEINKYLCSSFLMDREPDSWNHIVDTKLSEITAFIDKKLIVEPCSMIHSMNTFPSNIIQPGVSVELDEAIVKYNIAQTNFKEIHTFLNGIINFNENTTTPIEYIKIHETEKSGLCLVITTTRLAKLKHWIAVGTNSTKKKDRILPITDDLFINLDDLKYVKSSGTNYEILFPELNDTCRTILYYKGFLNKLIAETYLQVLAELEDKYFHDIANISSYIAKLDVLVTKTYTAKKYNYCKPVINTEATKAGFDATDMRHCLIEHLQQDEIYVPNDISLGDIDSRDGILLYGTNAVGKTSLIRSIGVSIIMAQTGMYVPCSSFVYKPYTAIFSRILGNDNIFKGLSTFAVEMSELRVILKLADENSLILGDELCSGTEMQSALSIFVAGLLDLNKKNSSYIFATHFHEIVNYEEIIQMERLSKMHMEVLYNREQDLLIYNRKLKDGSGPQIYGLEVCKSLHLDVAFLEKAYEIRNKYNPEIHGTLSNKQSTYNAKKIKGICEICKENIGEDVHHLQHQRDANDNGFINTFHKNHKANLITVCEKCHHALHDNVTNKVYVKKKTSNGMKLM
jgi:DNA mismatch repair protein MutS